MLDSLLTTLTSQTTTVGTGILAVVIGLISGLLISWLYIYTNRQNYSQSLAWTLVFMPAVIGPIITLVGSNITATTSSMAESAGASLAINGDYYGARSSGYVIRNGELLRSTKASDSQEDMVLWSDGSMTIINEGDYTAQELLDKGAVQVLSFGPGLIIDGEISVDSNDEVGKAMASNPRTAVGYLGENHYILVVADGRTSASEGLSLLQLAEFMQTLGVSQAYNLDGGGSSTMYYNGEIINNPTTNGSVSERKVSDILYVK